MGHSTAPYSTRQVVNAMLAWGFTPCPERNMGGHLAFRGPDGTVVGVSQGSGSQTSYKMIRKAVRATPANSIQEFIAGPKKVKVSLVKTKDLSATAQVLSTIPAEPETPVLTLDQEKDMTIMTEQDSTNIVSTRGGRRAGTVYQSHYRYGEGKQKVLEVLKMAGPEGASLQTIADILEVPSKIVSNNLQHLLPTGKVERVRVGVYRLKDTTSTPAVSPFPVQEPLPADAPTEPAMPVAVPAPEPVTVEPATVTPLEIPAQAEPQEPVDPEPSDIVVDGVALTYVGKRRNGDSLYETADGSLATIVTKPVIVYL